MSAERYQSGPYKDRHWPLFILFNPWITIGWCRLGNVRSASSGEASILDLDRSSFLADADCHFFDQYRRIIFFCRDGLMFSWPNKWEHASFGRNETSVELAQKNLAYLHCKFFMQHRNKKNSPAVRKNSIGQRAFFFLKKIAQCRLKNISRDYFTTVVGYWVFYSIVEWNMHEDG